MATILCYSLTLYIFSFFFLFFSANSLYFQKPGFDASDATMVYLGAAEATAGEVDFNIQEDYTCQVGWAIYGQRVMLWDSNTGRITDFTTHFSIIVDTQGNPPGQYGHGIAFFLAPVGFQIPPNSAGGFLGLFNTTTLASPSRSHTVHVEFDSFPNAEFNETVEHVGINNHSIFSSVYTPWNASLHSGDTTYVTITYNSSTKNLSVSWQYQNTSNSQEKTHLSYQIDVMKVLPEWVTVGFSAARGSYGELHFLKSWEFNSTLDLSGEESNNTKLVVILIPLLGGVLLVGAIAACALVWSWRRRRRNQKKTRRGATTDLTSINDDLERGAGPRRFSYKDLVLATNNFSMHRKLGQGGFGSVYRGYLSDLDLAVAVKKISKDSRQGKKEYVTEVRVISSLRHRNLVQLIGWCHEKGEFLLVYEYMQNGSLDSHLFGKKSPLSWSLRYRITFGLASGLLYLHEEWEQCVIHRDIKSSNIMLDSNFNVKLGDFGLAKLIDHEISPKTTGLAGTIGYLAPEYVSSGKATKESDIYSFGMVSLEIATGRKAVELMDGKDGDKGLVEWVWDHYGKGELLAAMDEKVQKDFDERQVECLMIVGLWCAHPDASLRPSIKQALHVLNFEANLPNLPPTKPVPTYRVPTLLVISEEPASITTSLHQMGR
ncbi:hypothetical protein L6164_017698 [Bauhinia variegata]|uniref:Uncharacterized protein n=1 Tax=Bauhinia variegata TaxID=167791 RepID=A0ACB9NC84_BAUVA|nr:hypothetical protein L6164_017698 [Bauhinia variegata]